MLLAAFGFYHALAIGLLIGVFIMIGKWLKQRYKK
jgi:hypothetical protein